MDRAVAVPLIPITVYMRAHRSQNKLLAGEAAIVRAESLRTRCRRAFSGGQAHGAARIQLYDDLDHRQKKPRD
jgi:hypothetical protein